jgi:hypothetical protein
MDSDGEEEGTVAVKVCRWSREKDNYTNLERSNGRS